MRFIKFLATLLLGFQLGELINEYREVKTRSDQTFWKFLKNYIPYNAKELKSYISDIWQHADQPEEIKRIQREALFPRLKD